MTTHHKKDDEKDTPVEKPLGAPPPSPMPERTGTTLPPSQRFVPILAHTIVDLSAIAAVTVFVVLGKLDTTIALAIIGGVAGVWVTGTGLAGNLVKAVKKKKPHGG